MGMNFHSSFSAGTIFWPIFPVGKGLNRDPGYKRLQEITSFLSDLTFYCFPMNQTFYFCFLGALRYHRGDREMILDDLEREAYLEDKYRHLLKEVKDEEKYRHM